MKLHIFRLSGHDFVHYRKIEIGANDRAVYQQSISCFIVYANFDWFLINLAVHSFYSFLYGNTFSITFMPHKFVIISVTFLAIHIIIVYRRICKCRYNQIKAIFKSAYYCCIDTFIGLKSNNNYVFFIIFC